MREGLIVGRRALDQNPLVFHIVVGDGKRAGAIKGIRCTYNVDASDVLAVRWGQVAGEGHRIESIHLLNKFERRGWFFLKDAYLAEGNETGYLDYLDWEQSTATLPAEDRTPFPDELLPSRVVQLRKGKTAKPEPWRPKHGTHPKPAKHAAGKAANA